MVHVEKGKNGSHKNENLAANSILTRKEHVKYRVGLYLFFISLCAHQLIARETDYVEIILLYQNTSCC